MTLMVLQAIETRYFGPSNVRGSRVKATAAAGSLTVGWDDALNPEQNHQRAAQMLAIKFDWKGDLAQGVLASGHHVFVFTSRHD